MSFRVKLLAASRCFVERQHSRVHVLLVEVDVARDGPEIFVSHDFHQRPQVYLVAHRTGSESVPEIVDHERCVQLRLLRFNCR